MRRVSHSRLPAFKATVMDAMPRLVERDSSATAGIMLSSFPQEHAAAVRQLQGSPNLQYKYLKAALQVVFSSTGCSSPAFLLKDAERTRS